MSDYYVFSAAFLADLEQVTATDWQEAVRAHATRLGLTGRVACIAVDEVRLSDVSSLAADVDVFPL